MCPHWALFQLAFFQKRIPPDQTAGSLELIRGWERAHSSKEYAPLQRKALLDWIKSQEDITLQLYQGPLLVTIRRAALARLGQ